MTPATKGRGKTAMWLREHISYAGENCLKWPFAHDCRGYGSMGYEGRSYKAHRLMCEFAHGPAPTPEHQAAHSCGNGHLLCVNPRHLSWKTPTENMADSVKHGTARFERGRPRFRLTPEQVQQILALKDKKTQEEIGALFGVTWRQIGKIHRGATWRGGTVNKGGFRPGDPRNPFASRPRIKGRIVSAS